MGCGIVRIAVEPDIQRFQRVTAAANVLGDAGGAGGNIRITGFARLIHIVVQRNIKALTLTGHFRNQQGIHSGCGDRPVNRCRMFTNATVFFGCALSVGGVRD